MLGANLWNIYIRAIMSYYVATLTLICSFSYNINWKLSLNYVIINTEFNRTNRSRYPLQRLLISLVYTSHDLRHIHASTSGWTQPLRKSVVWKAEWRSLGYMSQSTIYYHIMSITPLPNDKVCCMQVLLAKSQCLKACFDLLVCRKHHLPPVLHPALCWHPGGRSMEGREYTWTPTRYWSDWGQTEDHTRE